MSEAYPDNRNAGSAPVAATERAARRSLALLALLFAGVLVSYLASGVHFIKPGESALVLRFGHLQPRAHGPGLLIAFPEPIDRVVRLATGGPRELKLESWQARELPRTTHNESEFGPLRHHLNPARDGYTLTGDANIVQSSFSLRYQIIDPVRFYSIAADPDALIAALFYQTAARTLARAPIDEIIPSGLAAYRDRTLAELEKQLTPLDLGIALGGLEIRELLPPKPVLPAFQDVNSAKVEGQTYVEEARTYRARTRQMAEAEANGIRARATAEAAAVLTRAQGEADGFLAILGASREAPRELRERLLTEAREEVLPKLRQVAVLPGDGARTLLVRPQTADAK
jgi:membrane protease subunit HflK